MARCVDLVFPTPIRSAYSYAVPDGVDVALGMRVVAPFGRQELTGYAVTAVEDRPDAGPYPLKAVGKVLDKAPLFDAAGLGMARWMADMYFCSVGEALAAMLPDARRERAYDDWGGDEISPDPVGIQLSDEQREGLAEICSRPDGMSYLFGITGSGKTEVFLQAAAETLREGRSVIYLVPEIALTRQVATAIEARFAGQAAVLHSRLTPSQRLSEWRRIQRGEARLVVGARSAVFAPVARLGLVVVDEEHESSYKSSNTPRYHARQVAMRRCLDEKARLVMGSATPSVEAWHLMREGRLRAVRLNRRLAGGAPPKVSVVPLNGNDHSLSDELVRRIRETHSAGKQTILFLNRRGFAYFFHCRTCGYEMACKRCSVGMTYHKSRNVMMCHYCGSSARIPERCPSCNSLDVGYAGFGTEKVEEDVARLFPDLRVGRLDTDSTANKGVLESMIDDFRQGRIDLLLGTQMVAKGLNFPGVRLVGIVNADMGLHLPDFRAAERSFGLITQVAGRAGRYADDGEVVIQTFNPASLVIQWAAARDSESFYDYELGQRKLQGFPPFGRLIRLVFRAKDGGKAAAAAREFKAAHGARLAAFAEVLGPAECPLAKVNNNVRFQLLLVARDFGRCHAGLGAALATYKAPAGVYLEIDTDPVSLL